MFGQPIRVGRLFGFNIILSWSFILLLGVVSINLAYTSPNFVNGLILGLLSLLLVFGSVLLHEIGHSLVARRLGIGIAEIELHFFGGAAKMLSMPKTPRDEILISVAGPLVSFGLAAIFLVLSALVPDVLGVLGLLVYANTMLGIFNLLPALPMDGGRVLRAALASRYGTLRATEIAVTVARVVAVGIAVYFLSNGAFYGVLIAFFIWMLGSRELRIARLMHGVQSGLGGVQKSWFSVRQSGTDVHQSGVEVFDRSGAPLGVASNSGYYEVSSHGDETIPNTTAQPSPGFGFSSKPMHRWGWSHASYGNKEGGETKQRHIVIRGPGGRLWIVNQR